MKTRLIHQTIMAVSTAALLAHNAQGAESAQKAGDTKPPLEHDAPIDYDERKYIFAPLDTIKDDLFGGQWTMQTGATVFYRDNNSSADKGVSFGFVQGDYKSKDFHGISAGGGFLYAPEIWEDQSGDYDDSFDQPAQVRRLFL